MNKSKLITTFIWIIFIVLMLLIYLSIKEENKKNISVHDHTEKWLLPISFSEIGLIEIYYKNFINEFKVDDPNKEGEHIGPVISETQFNKIQNLIQKGIDEGAKLVAGGTGKPDGLSNGYYVKPTVFADVNNNMEIARTEIFGPVLSVIPFENENEAIKIANDTDYGLTNYIQSQDKEKIQRVARKLRSGMVDVNGAGIAVDAPFGGYKHSGIGREAGKEGLLEFLEVKSVGGWN